MRVATSRLLVLFAIALGVLATACSSSDAADPDVPATNVPSSSSDSNMSDGAQPTATSDQPAWVTDALSEQETIRYIANTGGVGVSHRSACEDGARIDGVWPERTELEIVLADDADCTDWTLLTDGEITSWVSDKYLSQTAPSTGSATTGSANTVQIEVINFSGNLIPTSQLRVRPFGYTYNNAVYVSGCEQSWHPIGDSAVALSGKVIADPSPDSCGFGAVRFVPAYWISVNR